MSKFHCPSCEEVTSTTGTPNSVQGYFISDAAVHALEVEIDLEPHGIYLPGLMELLGARRGHQCPECDRVALNEEEG